MLTRNLILPVVITGAIGLPLMMSNPESRPEDATGIASHSSPYEWQGPIGSNGNLYFPGDPAGAHMPAGPTEFIPAVELSSIFNFENSVDGIRSGFRRLSVVAGENGWQGLRTDLVTGMGAADLHGCITWYFDSGGRMQRIAFRGWTGDIQNLKSLLSEQFLLSSGGTSGVRETMKLSSWGSITSAAVFQMPQVIQQDSPQSQYAVAVELNRSSSYSISPAMQAAMQAAMQ